MMTTKKWVLVQSTVFGRMYFRRFTGCQPGKFGPRWTFNRQNAMELPLNTHRDSLACIRNTVEWITKKETRWVKA